MKIEQLNVKLPGRFNCGLKELIETQIKKLCMPRNVSKGTELDMSLEELWLRLEQEVFELKEAIDMGLPKDDIILECADVANFAAMIVEKVRKSD